MDETKWVRRQLTKFLDVDDEAIWVVLHRPIRTKTAAGGFIDSGEQLLLPQRFRIIPFKRRLTLEYELTRDREAAKNIHYVLVGDAQADLIAGDWFEHEEAEYEAKFVSKRTLHRISAGVIVRGEAVNP